MTCPSGGGGTSLAFLKDSNQFPKCFYPKFFRISPDIDLEVEPVIKSQK